MGASQSISPLHSESIGTDDSPSLGEEKEDWIRTPPGISSQELAAAIAREVQDKLARKVYNTDDIHYVSKVSLSLFRGEEYREAPALSAAQLEKLRALCQLWEVDLRPPHQITSHRPVIGPIIVAIKKMLFPIVKIFMKDALRQQRDFNAAVISLCAELAAQIERK